MKFIKTYEQKTNESVFVSLVSGFIVLKKIITLLVANSPSKRKKQISASRVSGDIKYLRPDDKGISEKIEKLTGVKTEIFKCESKLGPAFAHVKEIYYDERLNSILTERELIAVLLHELYHTNKKHTNKKILQDIFLWTPVMFLGGWLYFLLAEFVGPIVMSILSKNYEYKSDGYAKKFGYGEDLASALVKINKNIKIWEIEKKIGVLTKMFAKLYKNFQSHPTLENRVKKLYKEKSPTEFIEYVNSNSEEYSKEKANSKIGYAELSKRYDSEIDFWDEVVKSKK